MNKNLLIVVLEWITVWYFLFISEFFVLLLKSLNMKICWSEFQLRDSSQFTGKYNNPELEPVFSEFGFLPHNGTPASQAEGCWQEWKAGPRELGVGQLQDGPDGEEESVSCWWLETELLSFSQSEVRRGFIWVVSLFTVARKWVGVTGRKMRPMHFRW